MRFAIILVLIVSAGAALAQPDLWKQVNPDYDPPKLGDVKLSPDRLAAIHKLLRENRLSGSWGCEGEDEIQELLKGLIYNKIPLSDTQEVLLVEAGAGCARGGQGSNGAMWLIHFDGATPVLMASPTDDFSGWIYSVQPSASHGFHDIVLGWHMSAGESSLTYFRYDGKSYKALGSATRTVDDDDKAKITPKP